MSGLNNFFSYDRLVSAYEDKVLHDPDTTKIYFDLVKEYDSTSFEKFVEYVLENASTQNCSDISASCYINEHFR